MEYSLDKKHSHSRTLWLGAELVLIFIGLPVLFVVQDHLLHPSMFVLPILALLVWYLRQHPEFHLRDLFRWNVPRTALWQHLGIVLLCFVALAAYTYAVEPENLFNLPTRNPAIWLLFIIVYPLFSAYGQEVIYRAFLHLRYRSLLGDGWLFIVVSAALFSFVHIIYYSPLSIILTFVMGLYLAWVYMRYRSTLFVAVLHGLLGDAAFTVGLGQHFWLDIAKVL